MRRGALAATAAVGLLLVGGCTDEPSASSTPDAPVAAVADGAGPAPSASGPAPLPPDASSTMDAAELALARRLAVGEGEGWQPSTCGVVRVAERGADFYGWVVCSTEYPDVTSSMAGVVGVRDGRLWSPRDGAMLRPDLVEALGEDGADGVLDRQDELTRTAEQRHG